MSEIPQQFGSDDSLLGILTLPDPAHEVQGERTALIVYNAGVLPRLGPHRLNVKLARAAATRGFHTLRFDLAGQGDSRSAVAEGDYRAQAVRDICAAMDHLETTSKIRRFILIGICSGAVNAYWTALADPRVYGVLLFDGYWYRSRWTSLVRNWKRARASSWRTKLDALWRRLPRLRPRPGKDMKEHAEIFDEGMSEHPTVAQFAASMQKLVDRGASVQLVYSGSVIDYYCYQRQFLDVFGGYSFSERVRCHFRPDIDHTFVTLEGQRQMIDLTLNWASEIVPAKPSP
jgi:pimeloyl-ACP methyl ester carboxylesterase